MGPKLESLLRKVAIIGCAAVHPAHPLPSTLVLFVIKTILNQKRIDAKSNLENIFEISGILLLEIHNFKEGNFFKVPL